MVAGWDERLQNYANRFFRQYGNSPASGAAEQAVAAQLRGTEWEYLVPTSWTARALTGVDTSAQNRANMRLETDARTISRLGGWDPVSGRVLDIASPSLKRKIEIGGGPLGSLMSSDNQTLGLDDAWKLLAGIPALLGAAKSAAGAHPYISGALVAGPALYAAEQYAERSGVRGGAGFIGSSGGGLTRSSAGGSGKLYYSPEDVVMTPFGPRVERNGKFFKVRPTIYGWTMIRRMNALNPRAARRAIRRIKGGKRFAKLVTSLTSKR